MKTRTLLSALMLSAGLACLVSCKKLMSEAMSAVMESAFNHDYQDSEKWGKVVTQSVPVLAFHEVELSGAVRLEYTQDSIYSLEVYGNEKAIEAYAISVEDGELEASLKENGGSVGKNTPAITLRITAPSLSEIQGAGAADIVFKDSIAQDEELDISISGAGKLDLGTYLKLNGLDMTVSGSGEVSMPSLCCTEDVEMELMGVADIDGKISCRKLKLKMSGAGDGKLDIDCRLARISASGSVNATLSGQCDDISYTASGSSTVKTDGLKTGKE